MRKPTNSIQAQMQTVLVSTAATSSTGALVTATSALNIDNGEVALLSTDLDAADYGELTATPDGTKVQVVQGTPVSNNTNNADRWGVGNPAVVKSGEVIKGQVRSLTTTNYTSGAYAMHAATAFPTIVVNESYGMFIELDGRRNEKEFGENTDMQSFNVETPSALPTSGLDLVLQTIALKANGQSRLVFGNKHYVVLGLNIAGGAGTALSALVNNNSAVSFMEQDGVTFTLQSTTPLVRGLANLIAASALTVNSTIEVLGSVTPGSAATVDALVVVGLDVDPAAYEDDIFQVRTDVTLNPKDGFVDDKVSLVTDSKVYASEGVNSGRQLTIENQNRAQLDIHTRQLTPYMEYFSQGYKYIDEDLNYGSFIVDFYGNESTIDHEYIYEKSLMVLWPQTEATNLTVATIGAATPAEAAPAVVGQLTTWVNA